MEDAHEIYAPDGASQRYVSFAVYDGHGGDDVAIKASKFCVKSIVEEEGFKKYLGGANSAAEEKMSWLRDACEQGMLKCDARIRETNRIDGEDCDESGCTANVNFMTDEYHVCANVGDTRAVLCCNGEAVEMSKDHKPTNPDEQKRIEAAGARVTRKRVNAAIAVSRSLGDYFFKSNEKTHPWGQPIICKPDVVVRPRSKEEDEFYLCCCDGVWDVMTNEEGVRFVRDLLKEGEKDLTKISSDLLNTCLEKGSKDNMTAVIVLLPAGQKLIPGGCCSIS